MGSNMALLYPPFDSMCGSLSGHLEPAHQPEEPGDIPSSAVKDRAVSVSLVYN